MDNSTQNNWCAQLRMNGDLNFRKNEIHATHDHWHFIALVRNTTLLPQNNLYQQYLFSKVFQKIGLTFTIILFFWLKNIFFPCKIILNWSLRKHFVKLDVKSFYSKKYMILLTKFLPNKICFNRFEKSLFSDMEKKNTSSMFLVLYCSCTKLNFKSSSFVFSMLGGLLYLIFLKYYK